MSKVSVHDGGRALISDMQTWDIFKVLKTFINEPKQQTHLEALSGNCGFVLLASLPHLEVKKAIRVIPGVEIEI
jgi:hypothetical protein